MKKLFSIVLVSMMSLTFSFAQTVTEGNVSFNKSELNGFTINIPGVDSKTAVAAMQEYFSEQSFAKPKTESKFTVYKAQRFTLFGEGSYDIYFNAVDKGKKKDQSVDINLICSLGNMNTVSSNGDATTADNVKTFMTKCPKIIEKYQLKQKIEQLKKDMEKAQKEKEKNEKEIAKMQKAMSKANENHSGLLKQIEEYNKVLKGFSIE